MKIAIIGAGAAGLASIRYALAYGVECVAYEITDNVGGTWVYYEDVPDEHHDQVPTSMYYSLRTNLPTCLMEFRDYKFKPKSGRCFPGHAEVLEYIENFARDYNLLPYIKFSHKVLSVSQKNEKWTLVTENLKSGEHLHQEFDGVMVCAGHFSSPYYPTFSGMDTFSGHQVHSCYYKRNNSYKDKTVLMIGKGPSALDMCREVAQVADKVFLSHHGPPLNFRQKNITEKPEIVKIDKNVIYFEDDTTECVEAIIYCTGYKYEYPFLDPSCEITNNDMILNPLYKRFINAKHPTMCIIGLLQKTIVFQLLDLQAEVFIRILIGHVKLPSTEEMLSEVQKENDEKIRQNIVGSRFYFLGSSGIPIYFRELYELGDCKPFAPVLFKVYVKNADLLSNNFDELRNQVFEIIDDYTYKHYLTTENHFNERN